MSLSVEAFAVREITAVLAKKMAELRALRRAVRLQMTMLGRQYGRRRSVGRAGRDRARRSRAKYSRPSVP